MLKFVFTSSSCCCSFMGSCQLTNTNSCGVRSFVDWLAECLHAACMMLRVASWCCLLITCMLCDSGCVHNRLHPTLHAVARHMHGACNSLLGCIIQYVRQGSPSCCVVRVVVSSDICSLLQRRMSHTCSRATGVCIVRMCMAGLIHAACISISKQRSSCRVLAATASQPKHTVLAQ